MNRAVQIAALWLFLCSPAAGAEDRPIAAPNWDREAAIAVVDETRVRDELALLFSQARSGLSDELLREVRRIAEDHRPDPERDRILFELAVALPELGPGLVDSKVLEYLSETRSRVLVPNEDHPGFGVPLYNIRAAAAGARQAADRQSETAPPNSHEDLMQALTAGNSSISAAQVRKARGRLTPEEIETVLARAADMEDSGRAAMIMAELSAGLLGHRAIADRLFQLLEHDALGSTAALLLAKSADPDIIVRLAETAESGRGLSSRRAESALAAVSPGEER